MDTELMLSKVALHLEARDIPIPAHLSLEARKYLAVAGAAPRAAWPEQADAAVWAAAAADFDARMMPAIEAALATVQVDLVTTRIGACEVYVATPHGMRAEARDFAYVDIHGGALVFGGGRFAMLLGALRAASIGCPVYAVDYRMPPAHPYPAALDDCLGVYRHLLSQRTPQQVAVGGISAGGNLAAATILRARDEGLPLPAAAILLTPELDLTETGDTFHTCRDIDVALKGGCMPANLLYAGGADLAHPYLSPLFGDFAPGFPPTFLQSGTRDLFLSNTVRMHRALLAAGQTAELHVWEAMPHAGFGGATLEDLEMVQAVHGFLQAQGWPVL